MEIFLSSSACTLSASHSLSSVCLHLTTSTITQSISEPYHMLKKRKKLKLAALQIRKLSM